MYIYEYLACLVSYCKGQVAVYIYLSKQQQLTTARPARANFERDERVLASDCAYVSGQQDGVRQGADQQP